MHQQQLVSRAISHMAAQAKEAKHRAAGGITAQYVFKYDDGDFHLKIAADLTARTATVTQTIVFGSEDPIVDVVDLEYEKEAKVYPLQIGCPVDCYIYSFKQFNCAGEKELKFYFSKQQVDYGEGPAYVMGPTMPNLDSLQAIYPCTKK